MIDSWKDFQMPKIEPKVVEYPSGFLLRQRNGGARYLTGLETILHILNGYIPPDRPLFERLTLKIRRWFGIKEKDELIKLLQMATAKREPLEILRAPYENRFFIEGYTFKRNLTGWETFLFVVFDIEPKEVRLSKGR